MGSPTREHYEGLLGLASRTDLRDESEHVIARDRQGNPADEMIVTRDGLRVYLHRAVFEETVQPLKGRYMLKQCDKVGCVASWHYLLSDTPFRASGFCPNGHRYRPEDGPSGSRECGRCREEKRARLRTGGLNGWQLQVAKTACPFGHSYTPDNTYRYPTANGGVRRKCKVCAKARAMGEDPANVAPF